MSVPDIMPQVLLAHHLKQLRLPMALREYDKVARECARDGAGHPRYLLRLLELEQICVMPQRRGPAPGPDCGRLPSSRSGGESP
jgi:hypothetical protein